VVSVTTYPYDTIVYITDVIGGVEYQGSGVLLSPDEVLTATHVVYSSVYGVASDVQVTPAYDGLGTTTSESIPFGTQSGALVHYNQIQDANGLISGFYSQFDYAVIHLAHPFSGLGNMGVEANFTGGEVSVSGYPANADGTQVTDPEYVSKDPRYTLLDGAGIGEGSSGGPVWVEQGGGPEVVGLVSSANETTGEGYFTQITTTALTTIEGWVAADDAACFAAGTRIAAPEGERPVETLRVGDLVLLARGGVARVAWLGHRTVRCDRHPRPCDVWPVRIRRGAFGEGLPRRDLLLSPDHALFLDGVLIPVRHLVDGDAVARIAATSVAYWHVELARHDVLLAEGLPCESFLDTGNRASFANGGAAVRLHADFAQRQWDADACAPVLLAGGRLRALRDRLRGMRAASVAPVPHGARPHVRQRG
jgi:V8-like Glu-specific endopeptidase